MTKRFMSLPQFNALAGAYAERAAELAVEDSEVNAWLIGEMNGMYELPINDEPTIHELGEHYTKRMQGFMKTLQDEMDEGRLILVSMVILKEFEDGVRDTVTLQELMERVAAQGVTSNKAADKFCTQFMSYVNRNDLDIEANIEKFIMVGLADWLADMNVFNKSEAAKYGIPLDAVFKIVMASNFTKLNEDGTVTKDEHGKFQKGPNYIAPEQHIEALLFHRAEMLQDFDEQRQEIQNYSLVTVPLLTTEVIPLVEGDEEEEEVDEDDEEIIEI